MQEVRIAQIELAQRYSVSQGTVRKAINELAEQNLLVRHQGKGTFVASHSEERKNFPFLKIIPDQAALDSVSASLIDFWRIKLDPDSARKLQMRASSSAYLIRRLLSPGGEAVVYEEIRLPAMFFDGLTAETIVAAGGPGSHSSGTPLPLQSDACRILR